MNELRPDRPPATTVAFVDVPRAGQELQGMVYLVEGPIGAGKSTFATALADAACAVAFDIDDWMARPSRVDRPETFCVEGYLSRRRRCIEQILADAATVVDAGRNVVLELGLARRHLRRDFYRHAAAAGWALTIYALDAPREVRRARVHARNAARGADVPIDVPDLAFERADGLWEPLGEFETRGMRFRLLPG